MCFQHPLTLPPPLEVVCFLPLSAFSCFGIHFHHNNSLCIFHRVSSPFSFIPSKKGVVKQCCSIGTSFFRPSLRLYSLLDRSRLDTNHFLGCSLEYPLGSLIGCKLPMIDPCRMCQARSCHS